MLQALVHIPLTEDTIIVKCARYISQLMKKYTITMQPPLFRQSLRYFVQFISANKFVGLCDALRLLQTLIKNNFKTTENVPLTDDETVELLEICEILMQLINDPNSMQKTTSCIYDGDPAIEIKSSAAFCLEAILTFYERIPQLDMQKESITTVLMALIYSMRYNEFADQNYSTLMRAALSSLRYIGVTDKVWCTEYIGDLLGACLSSMLFGLEQFEYQPAHKLQSSQQAIQDTNRDRKLKTGGKVIKQRKPRLTAPLKVRKNDRPVENTKIEVDGAESNYAFLFGESSGSMSFL